ncbi:SCO family protein [Paraburkholderia sp. HP33-1]|uniref:SCO family protein n=1 Tax=Paraburkholderia sp. HP33-1 TaxID=2883243 RepID=UPI001F1FC063|nr:SCO family protein [Paraburkholderia sp. HP33-1]
MCAAAATIALAQPPSLIGGHFALVTTAGAAVTEQSYRGKWQLIYFGYTSCPDVCPTVLTEVSVALEALGPLAGKIQPLFITVDPAHDTAQLLSAYLGSFDARIVGLTGTPEQVKVAAKSYRVFYRIRKLKDDAYTVDHSSFLFLLNPDGEFSALLSGDLPGHKLADELRKRVR